jgi:hypothetical protein
MEKVNPKEIIDGIAVMCAYDKLVDIVDVIPNPRNPNKHTDKQIDILARVIKAQGWRTPITVSTRSGFIVRGHGRLMAVQSLGAQFVPVDYQDYENEAQEWADMIADNRVAELSDTDEDMLKDLLQEIKAGALDIDLDLTGYTDEEINNLFKTDEQKQEDELAERLGGDYNYTESYGVIIMCDNESHQQEVYNKMIAQGYKVKVVSV